MTCRFLGTCALLVLAPMVFAQQGDLRAKPYEPRKIVLSPQPVTKDEANLIFAKVNEAIVRAIPDLKPAATHLAGSAPVTREEVVDQFDRIFRMAKPEFKFTPKKVTYDPKILTIKDKATRVKLQNLIAWGCIDRVGILATARKNTMGVLEFGDAIGLLTARVAELTHMPDPRFSPELQP